MVQRSIFPRAMAAAFGDRRASPLSLKHRDRNEFLGFPLPKSEMTKIVWRAFGPTLGVGISILAWVSPLPAEKSYMNRRVDERGTTIFVVSRIAELLFL